MPLLLLTQDGALITFYLIHQLPVAVGALQTILLLLLLHACLQVPVL
jgi:hypothetical protein